MGLLQMLNTSSLIHQEMRQSVLSVLQLKKVCISAVFIVFTVLMTNCCFIIAVYYSYSCIIMTEFSSAKHHPYKKENILQDSLSLAAKLGSQ